MNSDVDLEPVKTEIEIVVDSQFLKLARRAARVVCGSGVSQFADCLGAIVLIVRDVSQAEQPWTLERLEKQTGLYGWSDGPSQELVAAMIHVGFLQQQETPRGQRFVCGNWRDK